MSGEPGVSDAANPDAALDTVFETPPEPAEESREAPAAAGGKPDTTTPDAKPRDEKGRFVTPSSGEEPDAEAGEPAPAPSEPGTDAEPADATDDDDLTDLPEFVYRAVGQEQTFPGSFVSKDGEVLFTKDALPVLKQKLALADSFPGYRAQMQRDAATAANRAQAAEAMTEQIFAKMEELAANPDAAWEWWSNIAGNWHVLKADSKAAAAELKVKELEQRHQQASRAQEDAAQVPQMRGMVEEAIRQWGPEAGLDQAGQDRVIRRLSSPEWLDRLFPRAQDDDPVSGLRRGQRIGSLYQQQIAQELVWIRDLRGRDPKVDAAKRDNAKSAPKASKVPPTVSAGKGPAPKQSPKIPAFKSAKDADDWLFDEGNYKNL